MTVTPNKLKVRICVTYLPYCFASDYIWAWGFHNPSLLYLAWEGKEKSLVLIALAPWLLKVVDLKIELAKRNLDSSGLKQDLVQRYANISTSLYGYQQHFSQTTLSHDDTYLFSLVTNTRRFFKGYKRHWMRRSLVWPQRRCWCCLKTCLPLLLYPSFPDHHLTAHSAGWRYSCSWSSWSSPITPFPTPPASLQCKWWYRRF